MSSDCWVFRGAVKVLPCVKLFSTEAFVMWYLLLCCPAEELLKWLQAVELVALPAEELLRCLQAMVLSRKHISRQSDQAKGTDWKVPQ